MIRTWKNASLRTQLVAIISALLVVSLLALGGATYILLRSFLQEQMDNQLKTFQSSIAQAGVSPSDANGSSPFGFEYYVQFSYPDGTVYVQNRQEKDDPVLAHYTLPEANHLADRPFTVPGADGADPWRVIIVSPANIRGQSGSGPSTNFAGYVVVGLPYTDLNNTMERLATVIAGVALLAVALGIVIARWTVTRSFLPLSRVEKTAAAIAAGDLSRRVEIENPATEVGRLSGSLNAMLAHIESAFAARTASERRMRRFVADASHELRTPLVTIRGFSELYRQGALQSSENVMTAMGRIESEAKRMGELVEDLLMLARIDEQRPLQRKPVDLLLFGHDAVIDARAAAPDREIKVVGLDGGPGTSAPASGDEAKLRQVVANLMGNCLRYTPEGSPVEIAVGVTEADGGRRSVLQVRDHGPGISEEEAPRIFERFYRADSSRNRDTGGSGLGLAIVTALIAAHDGTVQVEPTPDGGATLVVSLPFQPPDDSDENDKLASDNQIQATQIQETQIQANNAGSSSTGA
ncbi:HAMP domain-containing histidine kinase [Paeniglutamicibacter antarcticus]|uniref:histidine kinase n=1 Tax=Arthrobacter terrae TaxID=2935737 RepID=A0A931G695_9MICC|nr:HAMP domain-containing sensor histidine kinase [Arthrobacter terrae]MBG0740410.1 HAMP domain-containing histidine kinase [Arthrobacter terrae]